MDLEEKGVHIYNGEATDPDIMTANNQGVPHEINSRS